MVDHVDRRATNVPARPTGPGRVPGGVRGAGTVGLPMTTSFRPQVASAFEVLAEGLAPFVDARMSALEPDEDWILMAASKLGKRRDVLVSLVDPHFQLEVINRWWGPAFAPVLPESMRPVITDLRTARNHWAHPDADHPFDRDYALQVHRWAEELLRAAGSPEADTVGELAEAVRWASLHEEARDSGQPEAALLFDELLRLEAQQETLNRELDEAREEASTAAGRTRALSRQLAELQAQYSAVAGLRDDYLSLQRQLDEERHVREADQHDTTELRGRLARTAEASSRLAAEAEVLRAELERTRSEMEELDPVESEIGRRWIWLVTALVIVLGVLIAVAAYIPR